MAFVLADRVKETTTTTGTGTITLAGASTGYQSFSAVGNGNSTYYTIAGQTTSEWEVGIGTYTSAGTTLSRTTVLASSNGGSLVTFSAGTKDVFVTYPAGRSVNVDSANTVVSVPQLSATSITNSGLTSGRVVYSTTSGLETDSANLTFDGTNAGIGASPTTGYRLSIADTTAKTQITSTTGTNLAWSLWTNTGGSVTAGIESSAGGAIFSGTGAYSAVFGHSGAYPVSFATSNTERVRIDSSGNVMVGTTNAGGGLFKVQAATNICLGVANATQVTGSITLNAINNANTANIPFDIRASAIYASTGISTTASAANAYFNNSSFNQFLRSTSALKYKTNIRDLESIDVNKFRPVRYNSLCEADDKTKEHFGIIADEVDAAGIKELVTYGEDNQIEGFQYERLTVVLLKTMQEQQALITALTARITSLETK